MKFVGIGLLALLGIGVGYVALNWAPDLPLEALREEFAPPPSQFLQLPMANVHMRDEGPENAAGEQTPILLLHGTSASLHTWQGWTEELRKDHRVIRVDLPGFGLTGPPSDDDYTMEAYVRFVVAVLDALQVPKVHIAGNSFGGRVAWEVAVARPDRVETLILVDASGYPPKSQSVPLGFRLAKMPGIALVRARVLPRVLIESSVRNVYGDPQKVTPELVDRYYAITRRAGNRASLVKRFEQAPHGLNAERIKQVKAPTLILWGSEDRLVVPEDAARFDRDIADSEVVMFDGLGHVPHEEDPHGTVEAVLTFLAKTVRATGSTATAGAGAGDAPANIAP